MRLKMDYRILKNLMSRLLAKYGLRVDQFLDLKSLKVIHPIIYLAFRGLALGIQLLQEYNDLDNIYEHLDEIKTNCC